MSTNPPPALDLCRGIEQMQEDKKNSKTFPNLIFRYWYAESEKHRQICVKCMFFFWQNLCKILRCFCKTRFIPKIKKNSGKLRIFVVIYLSLNLSRNFLFPCLSPSSHRNYSSSKLMYIYSCHCFYYLE